jgi:SAM-dependent methyltransferase
MSNLHDYTEQNRRAWNEIAEVRSRTRQPAEFFAAGGSQLDPRVLAAAGNVRGRALLHLQCATGEDTLSWAVAGADATGADISDAEIELARRKAADAGLAARFVASDVYALPAELQQSSFDIVFTGGGALVWLPDIERWARVVAAALRPGGRLIVEEEHPLAACLRIEAGRLVVDDDYFRRGSPWVSNGWYHFKGGEGAKESKNEFNWPIGDVVTALVRAGMRIEALEEFPSQPGWRFGDQLEQAQRLPGSFLLVAAKV